MPTPPAQTKALWRAFWRSRSAGPIVEFALVVPMLLMLVMGVVDFGRFYFIKNSLTSAVREGARVGAVKPAPCTDDLQTIRDVVKARFTAMGGSGLADANIITDCTTPNIKVSVSGYTVDFITPLFEMLDRDGSKSIGATAVFLWELSP